MKTTLQGLGRWFLWNNCTQYRSGEENSKFTIRNARNFTSKLSLKMAKSLLRNVSEIFTTTVRYPKVYSESVLLSWNELNGSLSVKVYPVRWKRRKVCPHYLWFSQQLFMGHGHDMEPVFLSDVSVQYVTLHRTKQYSLIPSKVRTIRTKFRRNTSDDLMEHCSGMLICGCTRKERWIHIKKAGFLWHARHLKSVKM